MEAPEKEFLDMKQNIKFRSVTDTFQKLKKNIPKIKQSPNIFVFADKTSNIYQMPEQKQKKLLHDVTKTYKKAPPKLEISINLEQKTLPSSLTWMIASSVQQEHPLLFH